MLTNLGGRFQATMPQEQRTGLKRTFTNEILDQLRAKTTEPAAACVTPAAAEVRLSSRKSRSKVTISLNDVCVYVRMCLKDVRVFVF